ncbi:hypothetical protein L2E82_24838 [Cichorium intybus]|uniref:Uncharacterized protein n=1 Tax=Cichorium intybus TaxID=13427 RepID=A0ACB9E2Y8_CICIN|nr:hypothetical protein L2E82_24838 [Cichorium intybus]
MSDSDDDELLQMALKEQSQRDVNYTRPSQSRFSKLGVNFVRPPSNHRSAKNPNPVTTTKPQHRRNAMEYHDDTEVEMLCISSGDEDSISDQKVGSRNRAKATGRGGAKDDDKVWAGEEPDTWKRVDETEWILPGKTALHWSVVRGAIQVADLLFEEGSHVNAADVYGYQTTHVAAQYGQTAYLYHIVTKWNADTDIPDNEGRSPLHWAAYKGFADSIRLLLFLDAFRGRQDKEGCTPLHWAAIRGNLEACTILVQAGKKDYSMVTDNTGPTPGEMLGKEQGGTKSGDAIVGLLGFPSVGKSTLLNKLTGTFSEVDSYVITYRGAKIQLLDLLGVIEDLERVKAICSEYRIHNAHVTLRFDATVDDLTDVIKGSRIYTLCIYVVNKIDQIT